MVKTDIWGSLDAAPAPTACSMKKWTSSVSPIPIINPMYPNTVVIMIDSKMIVLRIEAGVAPMAFRMPISRVRSFTDTSMMLLTPTIPAMRVRIPMMVTRKVMPSKIFIVSTYSDCALYTQRAC